MTDFEKFVVIPDLHGEADKLCSVVEAYESQSIHFVQLGDFIDRGPDSKETVNILWDIGATVLLGNHEIVLIAALDAEDEQQKQHWQEEVWKPNRKNFRFEQNLLSSYGIDDSLPAREAAAILRETLEVSGHFNFLKNLGLYFETPDFIAIHAGLTEDSWEQVQRPYLDDFGAKIRARNYDDEPVQIFDKKWKLATQPTAEPATDKIVVSGHAHNLKSQDDLNNPKRLRLASRLNRGFPLFVWQSWDEKVKAF